MRQWIVRFRSIYNLDWAHVGPFENYTAAHDYARDYLGYGDSASVGGADYHVELHALIDPTKE